MDWNKSQSFVTAATRNEQPSPPHIDTELMYVQETLKKDVCRSQYFCNIFFCLQK